jgi:hypothetical protein
MTSEIVLGCLVAFANPNVREPVAMVLSVEGNVTVRLEGKEAEPVMTMDMLDIGTRLSGHALRSV